MKYTKMFIAGLALPSVLLPFLLLFAWMGGFPQLLTVPFLHFIPLLWGIWNIVYFVFLEKILPGNSTIQMLLTGGILGLIVAICGVCWLHLPQLLGLPHSLTYLPLIIAPIVYAILWLFVVSPLNDLLQVERNY